MEISSYRLSSSSYGISLITFSTSGRYIVYVLEGQYIRIINTFTGKGLHRKCITLNIPKLVIRYLIISPDNTKIACVASNGYPVLLQYEFILYDITKECVIKRYDLNNKHTHYSITYSTDGRYIAIVYEVNVLVFCGNNGDIISTHKGRTNIGSRSAFFSADNNSMIIPSNDFYTIWDIISKRVSSKKHAYPYYVILSPDLVHYIRYPRFRANNKEIKHILNNDFSFILPDHITHIKFSYTGEYLSVHENDTLCIRNSNNGDIYFQSPSFRPYAIKFSHMCINNRYITIYTSRGYIHVFDMHGRWTPNRYLQFDNGHRRLSLYTWILAQKLQSERIDLPILPTEIWILIISMYWYNDTLLQ